MVAAVLGATGVGLGALGAHGLKHKLSAAQLENWKTAVFYQLFHAVAILSTAALCGASTTNRYGGNNNKQLQANDATINNYKRAGGSMAIGSIMFSGSIYMLCLNAGPKTLWGPMTPIGGIFMISGWVMVGFLGGPK
jgi:uncharacterized membrane protein YgdD (TMEM256/DUF423 family)